MVKSSDPFQNGGYLHFGPIKLYLKYQYITNSHFETAASFISTDFFSFPDDNDWTVFSNKADITNINVEFVDEADPLNCFKMAVAYNDGQSL